MKKSVKTDKTVKSSTTSQSTDLSAKHSVIRNRAGEHQKAQLTLFNRVSDVREARDNNEMTDFWQVAQALIICGLPYKEVPERSWTRKARTAAGDTLTVTFSATRSDLPIPFGADRGPLYHLINRALLKYFEILRSLDSDPDFALSDSLTDHERELRTFKRNERLSEARFVSWVSASSFLASLGREACGGRDNDELRERFSRLSACSISVVRSKANGIEESMVLPIIRAARLPAKRGTTSSAKDGAASNEPTGIEFGADFFQDFVAHHVPVSSHIIKALLYRPKLFDMVIWLSWRIFVAGKETFIPLDEIRQQIGSTDTNERRLMKSLADAIAICEQMGWKEIKARIDNGESSRWGVGRKKGIHLGPPNGGRYLYPSSDVRKRQLPSPDSPTPSTGQND